MPRGGSRKGAGRKSSWNNKETTVIRVPKIFADQLLGIAQRLDRGGSIEFVTKSKVSQIDLVTNSKVSQLELMPDDLPSIEPLGNKPLARRLGCDPTSLRRQRQKGNHQLAEYTSSKDPEGIVWEYRSGDKKYHPLSSFSDVD